MLKFDGGWRFDSPGKNPHGVIQDSSELIGKTANQGDQQSILEHFKGYFAVAAGATTGWSSSTSWAQTNLVNYTDKADDNAPMLIEVFYEACATLQKAYPEITVPDVNRIPAEHAAGYEIQPPSLITIELEPASGPARPTSAVDGLCRRRRPITPDPSTYALARTDVSSRRPMTSIPSAFG